ncbi:MAG TPA: RNA polymerase sigma-70 factor [Draconibacterium sp.]|nr:RNA polymerase sigma-70 factor [Draconibacterium sp.]
MASDINTNINWTTHEGFEALFKEHYSRMVSYAFNFLKEQEGSEEIVQEVFFQLWVNRKKTEIKTSIGSYLYRAVRNRCINLIKHIEIRENYKQQNSAEIDKQDKEYSDPLSISELDKKIRACIDNLPMQRKKIFLMSRYEEMTYVEIAEKMGLSKKTVENQMGKVLQYLRTELKEYMPLIIIFFNQILNGK